MLQVEGLDAVFIGPSDLSASMGHIGDAGPPEVVDTIEQAIKLIKAAGKYAGLMSLDPALAVRYTKIGASFIAVGVDTLVLAQGAKKIADQFKADPDKIDKKGPSTPASY